MMTTKPKSNNNIQLLTTLVDSDDEDESEYRFLVDEKHVKYVTVDPGVIPKDDRTFAPVLIATLPAFPPGDWNEGHISKDPRTGRPFFSRTARHDLRGIRTAWHQRRIDHLELKTLARVRQNIHTVACPGLFSGGDGDRPAAVLVKSAEFPWQIPFFEAETTAYEWIDGQGIGPQFLGHVTEEGRVVGFVTEHIDGARPAGAADLAACRSVLAKLHALGIKHGDVNRYNFLVRADGKAVLVDFETAQRCSDREELEAELLSLEQSLRDPSRRDGAGSPVLSDHFPPFPPP